MTPPAEKAELRKHFLALRAALSEESRRRFDRAICENLRRLPAYRKAAHVAVYASDGEEPDLAGLLRDEAKRFYFPRYDAAKKNYELVGVSDPASELVRAKFGLLEPRPELPAAPDGILAQMLYLSPAVACDGKGTRLGRGGGFYDRLLGGAKAAAAAIVYSCQMAEDLPEEPHDRKVDFAVTEEDILFFSQGERGLSPGEPR